MGKTLNIEVINDNIGDKKMEEGIIQRIEENKIKLMKYIEKLEIRPLVEIVEELKNENIEIKEAFVHYVILLTFDELRLNFENRLAILETIKFHEQIKMQVRANEALLEIFLDVFKRIKKQ